LHRLPFLTIKGWRIRWGDIIHLCISEEDRRNFVTHLALEMLHNGYILDAIDLYDMADVSWLKNAPCPFCRARDTTDRRRITPLPLPGSQSRHPARQ
jgi:hypothetical protein